jgi:flagellar hook assembly protein FlgD
VRLEVFDAAGRQVRTLAVGPFAAGYQSVEWDHRDAFGNLVRPGVYLYRLIAGSFRDQKKMVLLAR